MIHHGELGDDEDLAREIIVIARGIAPCISNFPEGSEDRADAVSILKRVYKDTTKRGSRFVKGKSIGPARIDYTDLESMFDGGPTRALRSLCDSQPVGGLSRGSFPKGRPVGQIWRERY